MCKLLSFNPHIIQHSKTTLLGIATIICPKGAWVSNRMRRSADPFRPHGLCRKLKDGSLLMDVFVKYHHDEQRVVINMPTTQVGETTWQDLVRLPPMIRHEIVRQICIEEL